MVRTFSDMCQYIGVPIATDKISYANTVVKFLGVKLNGMDRHLQITEEKRNKALNQLNLVIGKRTVTVKQIQELTGLLNFLAKIVVPGRLFTRRMYRRISQKTRKLLQHHHVSLDKEFKSDAKIWKKFLEETETYPMTLCRPFIDISEDLIATEIDLYTDSSANGKLGFGGIFYSRWFFWKMGARFHIQIQT